MKSLNIVKHGVYEDKDESMPDCTICLEAFGDDDDILVYGCDKKHYFHKKCGGDWL